MNIQYVIAGVLLLSGALVAWAGPDLCGEKEDGTPGPVEPEERPRLLMFAAACIVCGLVLLVATLLGFQAPRATEPGVP